MLSKAFKACYILHFDQQFTSISSLQSPTVYNLLPRSVARDDEHAAKDPQYYLLARYFLGPTAGQYTISILVVYY